MNNDGSNRPLIPLEPVDAVQITTLMDNVSDMTLAPQGPAKRAGLGSGPRVHSTFFEEGEVPGPLLAEHGFSALLTVRKGERERTVLFDTGVTADGMIENMRRLSLTPKDVEAIVLSHGHFDHTAGMEGLVRELGRGSLPVYIHPEFWSRRRIAISGGEPNEIPTTSKSALQGAGFEIVEERQPSFLLDRSVLITGEVDRTTAFEQGWPVHQRWQDGSWQPDPLILDDQAVVIHVRDKGLVVLTGCGHAGIINIVRYAQTLTGVTQIYAALGGFHLGGPSFEPVIPAVIDSFRNLDPTVIVPAHCTGWRAVHALAAALPDAFIQNAVGTRFEL